MIPMHLARAIRALVAPIVLAFAALAVPGPAQTRSLEYVPEFDAFVNMTDVTRLFFNGQYTSAPPGGDPQTEAGAHIDVTLTPIIRSRREADWQRDRYVWARVGYEAFGNPDNQGHGATERRGIVQLTNQFPLSGPLEIWLISRGEIDFRDIRGETSQRYRIRLSLEKEITESNGLLVVPYIRAEDLYDSRYNSWNRQIYQLGAEVGLTRAWRIEPYFSRQNDSQSKSANVDQLGLILKYFH
jgi:hypothetical protein